MSLIILSCFAFATGFFYIQKSEIEKQYKEVLARKEHKKIKERDYLEKLEKSQFILSTIFGDNVLDKPVLSTKVTATAYSARKEECDATPWFTASMTLSRVGVIAVSRDLEKEFGLSMGDFVFIPDYGLFRIEDRMNPRWTKRIDILHANKEAARRFGKRELEIIWIGKG